MEGEQDKHPSEHPSSMPNKTLGELIYDSMMATEKPNDSQIVLLSGAISLSEILAQYLLALKPKELVIFVGLRDHEIMETNYLAKKRREALLLLGVRSNKNELTKISSLTKEKRSQAYIEGGFYTMTSQIFLLDLLSKSEIKPQLIRRIFLRDCESVRTFKDQFSWINHLIKVQGDTPNSSNTFTQTIIISQKVSRLNVQTFENIYRFFGLKRVVLWPFGREEVMERLKSRTHFGQFEQCLKFSQNQSKINQLLDSLLKYCSSRWRGEDSSAESYCYELFTRQMDEDLDFDCSDVLLLNMYQIRAIMFKLSNFSPLSCYTSLMRFLTTDDQRSIWTTTNKKAEAIIDEITLRMRKAVFQVRVADPKEIDVDFFEQPQKYKLNSSLKFLLSKPRKITSMISILSKSSEQNLTKGTKSVVWISASSEKLCQHIHDELYQWISDLGELRKHRQLYQTLIATRDRRLAIVRHGISTKKTKSTHEAAQINENILSQHMYEELKLFFKFYCDFESNNLSNRDQQKHQVLKQNVNFLQKELLKNTFKFLDIKQLLKPVHQHPELIFYSGSIDLVVNGNTQLIFNSCQQPQLICQFLRLHNPSVIILYNPNIKLLRSLYLYAKDVSQVHGLNFPQSLEQMIHVNSLTKQDKNIWQIGKIRSTIPHYCDDFRTRVADITEFKIAGKSMLRYDTQNRADTFTMPTLAKNFIIIDKREYKSQLPCILYFSGFTTVPIVLETADYILSPDIAVEKKSVSTKDIHESIRSGRLDDQLKRMTAKFSKPYLLIQFNKNIPFQTQRLNVSFNHATRQSYRISIRKALAGLLRKYPRIRLIWSHSCEQTAEIFLELKKNRQQPDISIYRKQDEQDLPELSSQVERATAIVDI